MLFNKFYHMNEYIILASSTISYYSPTFILFNFDEDIQLLKIIIIDTHHAHRTQQGPYSSPHAALFQVTESPIKAIK